MRHKTKKIVSIMLSLCLLAGMVCFGSSFFTVRATDTPVRMIHYKHNNNNRGVIGQDVSFEKDVTYTFSFAYSMVSGEYNQNTGMYAKVLGKGLKGSILSVNDGYLYSSTVQAGSEKGFATEKLEGDTAKGIATYTFTWTGESGTGSVFFHVPANKSAEFYLADVTLYKSADATKTNLLQSIDETGNFNGWLHTGAWPEKDATTWVCNDGGERYTATIEAYDAEKFYTRIEMTKKMIHYTHNNNNRGVIGQDVSFEKDVTYTFSFAYSMVSGEYNQNTGMYAKVLGKGLKGSILSVNDGYLYSSTVQAGSEKGFATEKLEGDTAKGIATYTFTWTGESGTGSVFFHVPANKSAEFYLADVTLYKSADATKTNLLKSIDETGNFNGWLHTGAWPEKDATTWVCNDENVNGERFTATIEEYDADLFYSGEVRDKYMIHYLHNNNNRGFVGQDVNLEQGQMYTVSFDYSMVQGGFNLTSGMYFKVLSHALYGTNPAKLADAVLYSSDVNAGEAGGFTTGEVQEVAGRGTATYTFTWTEATGTGSVFFHIPASQSAEFYFANMTLYKSDDTQKSNLLVPESVTNDLTGYTHSAVKPSAGNKVWEVNDGGLRYTLTLEDFDMNIMRPGLSEDGGYANTGTVLTFLKDNYAYDLATAFYEEKTDKLFVGWADGDGNAPQANGVFHTGTTLYAQYIDCVLAADGDFAVRDVEVRTNGTIGLRYIVEKSDRLARELPGAGEYGTVVLPSAILDAEDSTEIWEDLTLDGTYNYNNTEYQADIVPADNTYKTLLDRIYYTLCVTDIDAENYDRQYTVKGYIRYTDYNGIDKVLYTDYASANLYATAKEQLKREGLTEAEQTVLNQIVSTVNTAKAAYWNSLTKTDVVGTSADKNTWIYQLGENGIMVREVEIDSGKNDGDLVEIIQLSDLHYNYVNARDREEANPTLFGTGTQKGTVTNRKWGANASHAFPVRNVLEYARTADQLVVTGDILDYLSRGAIELMNKEVCDKFPDAMLTLGNHEHVQRMQGDVAEVYSEDARLKWVYNEWPHNAAYLSKVLKNKVMLIQMDNGRKSFTQEQADLLTADLAIAKEQNYAVLIFVHIPLVTQNENETSVAPIRMNDPSSGNVNFNSNTSFVGAGDPVYDIIVKNADLIKGVFNGHWHSDYYTEIVATTSDGSKTVIPQYTLTGSCYEQGHALKIIVK